MYRTLYAPLAAAALLVATSALFATPPGQHAPASLFTSVMAVQQGQQGNQPSGRVNPGDQDQGNRNATRDRDQDQEDRGADRQGATGNPQRGDGAFLGVSTMPVTPDMRDREGLSVDKGVLVTEVVPDTAASQAGLRDGDVITKVDDKTINSRQDLQNAIRNKRPGDQVTIHVMRGKNEQTLTARLREMPDMGGMGMMGPPGNWRSFESNPGMMPFGNQSREIERLQRRVRELERRIQALEQSSGKSGGQSK